MLGLLALFGDTVYFLIVASYGEAAACCGWPRSSSCFCWRRRWSFYGPVEVAVIAAVCAIFCAVLPYGQVRPLERTVVVAGVLACAFAVQPAAHERRTGSHGAEAGRGAARRRRRRAKRSASGSPPISTTARCRASSACRCGWRFCASCSIATSTPAWRICKQLQALAQSQVRDLRAFLHSMRPVDVDGANLVATARRAAESFQKESGIPVTFLGANTPVGLPQEITSEVLQMLREALHNVQKHAGATRVAVAMEKTDRGLEISVDDNGHGFNFAGTYSLEELELLRLGPASLKRRARSLNADMLLESRPGAGRGAEIPDSACNEPPAAAGCSVRPGRSGRAAADAMPISRCRRFRAANRQPTFAFEARPEPGAGARGRVGHGRCAEPLGRAPGDSLLNFYSGFDGNTWRTGCGLRQTACSGEKRGMVLAPDPRTWEGSYIAANGSRAVHRQDAFWLLVPGRPERARRGLGSRASEGDALAKGPRPVLEPVPT